ncbi:MAG: hypothetical protein H0U71_07330 [Gammaproteobacteria bacterium]|nr:hypothetical protein [Gammaproteobacteria bacterium]
MLGTNDTKLQFNRTLKEITEGMRQLVKIVKTSDKGPASAPPKIIVIAPQPIIKIINLHPQYDGQPIQKSKELAKSYQQMVKEENCEFIDAGLIVSSSRLDGIHLDATDHGLLGYAVAEKVRQMSNLLK